MSADELALAPIAELAARYRTHELSPVEVADSLLERIERIDPHVNSYLTVLAFELREGARRAEHELMCRRPLGSLHGIPLSVKDNIAVAGSLTTAGSRILADWVAADDAVCVARLRAAGALVSGKTNLFEFAFGEAHEDFGHVRNPWRLDRSTAGSSTGSVASVASGLCWGSIGTDAGGSIRVPAAMCGVVGLKPTYGRVPREGVIATAPSLCHVGPIARTVGDVAAVFGALVGEDYEAQLDAGVRGLVLAVAAPQPSELIDPEVRAAFDGACGALRGLGAELREVEIPDLVTVRAMLWTIAAAEAADLHRERLASRGGDYNPIVRERLLRGAEIPAVAYVRAQRLRRWLATRVTESLEGAAALLLPVSPTTAYPLGARQVEIGGRREDVGQAVTRYTPLASATGRPALAVPCGLVGGLPAAFQIVGHPHDEATVLQIGRAYERSSTWRVRMPDGLAEVLAGRP